MGCRGHVCVCVRVRVRQLWDTGHLWDMAADRVPALCLKIWQDTSKVYFGFWILL